MAQCWLNSACNCEIVRNYQFAVRRLFAWYGVVPKGLLTFLGFLGNAEFSPRKSSGSHKKKFAVVFVTASDAMDFEGFTDCVVFLR